MRGFTHKIFLQRILERSNLIVDKGLVVFVVFLSEADLCISVERIFQT